MKCPKCGNKTTRVLDSRPFESGTMVRRRRQCASCSWKFFTMESVFVELPMVVKKDGRREAFSVPKVAKGIQAACQKRPIGQAQIDDLVERLLDRITRRGENEVSSDLIGRFVMAELKKLDEVSYVRFASVYLTFKEVNEFFDSIEKGALR